MYILDTDHLCLLQRQVTVEAMRLSKRLTECHPQHVYTTIVSFHEQVQGWTAYLAKAKDQSQIVRGYERLNILLTVYQQAQVLPF